MQHTAALCKIFAAVAAAAATAMVEKVVQLQPSSFLLADIAC